MEYDALKVVELFGLHKAHVHELAPVEGLVTHLEMRYLTLGAFYATGFDAMPLAGLVQEACGEKIARGSFIDLLHDEYGIVELLLVEEGVEVVQEAA